MRILLPLTTHVVLHGVDADLHLEVFGTCCARYADEKEGAREQISDVDGRNRFPSWHDIELRFSRFK